jgi:uncharacterized protein YciI
MYFAIICEDTPNSLEKRRAVRPAHLQRLETLNQAGRLLTAGALLKSESENLFEAGVQGSVIIAQFGNLEEAKSWAAADPFVTADIYARVTVFPYKVAFPHE